MIRRIKSLRVLAPSELMQVEKPAQYLGGERGSITKSDELINLRICLAFPDTYEVGMSHIGIQILYDLINRRPTWWAERAYQPRPDMEALLRREGALLNSLESRRPLVDFDVVGFSLQYELCSSGIFSILELGGIPLRAADRSESDPIVIGGGPVCYHPEPFADFFDCFLVGDGEELVPEFLEVYESLLSQGTPRRERLERLARIQGVYVPSLFEAEYDERGVFTGMRPLLEGYTEVRRRIIPTLEGAPFPTSPVVPNIQAVHDRLSVEVMRGCVRGCRFCQAGYLYRPQRERTPEDIIRIVEESLGNTGYEELSLLSLSTADYCSILPVLSALKDRFAQDDKLAISFPSTRVDALKPELLAEVQPIRRSGFTIAPEAGTQRLRDVINKGVTDEELMETCRNVFKLGWNSIKLYFMIGLPTETDEDIHGIIETGKRVKRIAGRKNTVTVSVSTLVPKPHTPFQWAEQLEVGEIIRRQKLLAMGLRANNIQFRWHKAESTHLEGVFARGDRKLGAVLERAYRLGSRLEGWVEELRDDVWDQAFLDTGIDPHHYLHERAADAPLPWDHISCDIPKSYFLKEWERSLATRTTPDCLTKSCSICGACDYDSVRNVLFDRVRTEGRLGIVDPPWNRIIEARETGAELPLTPGAIDADVASDPSLVQAKNYTLREYLKTETPESPRVERRPALPIVQRVRIRFTKRGRAAFSSHLELASVFFRSARRAQVPLAFSRGFNPRPKLVFGPPLQLGVESECELADLYLTETLGADQMMADLNAELPEGFVIHAARAIDLKSPPIQQTIDAHRFVATLPDELAGDAELLSRIEEFGKTWEDHRVTRNHPKKPTKTIPLRGTVLELTVDGPRIEYSVWFDQNSQTVKPLEVVECAVPDGSYLFQVKKADIVFVEETRAEFAVGA